MYKYYQGQFIPKNPKKYIGNPDNIIFRSRLEFKMFRYLDSHPEIIEWASEEFHIPYISPKDRKWHRYFPDLFIKKKNEKGIIEKIVIEIKPDSQTKPPKKGESKKAAKRFITESITYAVNKAKWDYADAFCKKRGLIFKIITEKEING